MSVIYTLWQRGKELIEGLAHTFDPPEVDSVFLEKDVHLNYEKIHEGFTFNF